jgi:hypothetical protein
VRTFLLNFFIRTNRARFFCDGLVDFVLPKHKKALQMLDLQGFFVCFEGLCEAKK